MHAIEYLEAPEQYKIGPIAVVVGKERFLKLEAIKQISAIVLGAGNDELSLIRLPCAELELKTVVDSLLTVSMWSPKQVVLVEDADEFVTNYRQGLEAYLERPAKKSVLILDVKSWPSKTRLAIKVSEIGLTVDCSELKGAPLLTWISQNCQRRHSKKIDRRAAQALVDLAGTELGLLDQELAKLSAFVGNAPAIDASAVERLVGGWKLETTWKMLDAVRDGQADSFIALLDKLLTAGEHPIKLLGGINFTYRSIAKATELSRQGMQLPEALTTGGVKPFAVQSTIPYLKRVTRKRAEQIFHWLLEADLDCKGASALPERFVLERLLLQLSGKI
jgi:DNA polymerase-3 subunit delta